MLFIGVVHADAQTVRGTVVDAETGETDRRQYYAPWNKYRNYDRPGR